MNKKANTVVFILCGTLVNLLLAFVFIGVLLFLVLRFQDHISEQLVTTLIPIAFLGGVVLAMIVYQKLSQFVISRFNLSDKLDPLFKFKHRKR